MFLDDIHLALNEGLPSAYLSTDTAFSLLSGTSVLTRKLMPGLSGLCPTPEGMLPIFIVDELPLGPEAGGIMFYTYRKKSSAGSEKERVPHWLVQIQQGSFAWHIMISDSINGKGKPINKAVFLKWRPKTFPQALEKHHNLVRSLPSDGFLLNSDLERVATSTFMLNEGFSSIANTYIDASWLKAAIMAGAGAEVEVDDPCVDAIKVVSVEWHVDASMAEYSE
jgi:hypothetical protein